MKSVRMLLLFVFGALHLVASAGLRVAVMGDSYSTYGGTDYLMPGGYAIYYHGSDYGVTSVEQQYWKIFINHIQGELCQNNSWSGSFLAARGVHQSFVDSRRIETLVGSNPDVILICGGTNDAWGSDGGNRVEIGEEMYADWEPKDLYKFFPAYTYLINELKTRLPDVEIVIVANSTDDYVNSGNTRRDTGIAPAYADAMKTIADHYGLCFVQCSEIEKSNYHPTVAGFATMGAQLCDAWDGYQKFKNSKSRALTPVSKDPAVVMPLSGTVEPIAVSNGLVYVFTDTTAPINLTLDAAATLTRALVVGGGGAGGGNCGGGGGAGGLIELDWSANPIALTENAEISLQVGAGGVAAATAGPGGNGGSSLLTVGGTTYTAEGGGGGGGGYNKGDNLNGRAGGSGGGGGGGNGQVGNAGVALDSDSGNPGGNGVSAGLPPGGGGGGAGTAGVAASGVMAGAGGVGKSSAITGKDVCYAGGGGGGFVNASYVPALGGDGGGGAGAGKTLSAESGTDGLGGGGGGGGGNGVPADGGNGGSGTVILRFYDISAMAYPEVAALVAATNSPTAMEIDVTLASAGADATGATVYFKYGIESVEENAALLGTLVTGATGHYVVDGLRLETTYHCEIIVSNNAATVHSVTLAGTIATMPVAKEMKPVVELTKPVTTATTASFNLSVPAIGEGAASAAVAVRLDMDGAEGAWTALAAAAQAGYQYAVALADLDEGAYYRYLVRVENDLGLSAIATNEFVAAAEEPSREDGRSVAIGERLADGDGKVIGLRLKFGYAGHVFKSSVLYAAYGAEDGGETTNGWAEVERVAEIAATTRTYDYTLPDGWGETVKAIRFFLDTDAMPSSEDYVADDLLAQWDAIENVGRGAHQDSTATWVNLCDPDFNLTYANSQAMATFTANGFTSGSSYFASQSDLAWWQALGNDYTFEASVTPSTSLMVNDVLMGSGGNTSPWALFCQKNANDWGFYEMQGTAGIGGVSIAANVIACDGTTRTHLAYVVSPTGTKVYVNGVLVNENETAISASFQSAAPFWVGAGYLNNRLFDGSIHAVRVYSRSLSADEVAANAKTDDLRFSGEALRVMSSSGIYNFEGAEPSVAVSAVAKRFAATLTVSVPYLGAGASSASVYSRVKDAANWDLVAESVAAGYVGAIELDGLEEGTDYAYEIRVVNDLAAEIVREVDFTTKSLQPPFEVAYETDTYALSLAPETSGFTLSSVGLEDVLVFTGGVTRLYVKNDCSLVRALVVGGGGAGGGNAGGGGGAGGFVELDLTANPIALAAGEEISFVVGAGGVGSSDDEQGANGEDSVLTIGETTYTAVGGGGGGSWSYSAGVTGGSGGGGANTKNGGGAKDVRAGSSGGNSVFALQVSAGGGGGGAGAPGGDSVASNTSRDAGAGGAGKSSDITGEPVTYAGGGGGGAVLHGAVKGNFGQGGAGGGGDGANLDNNDGRGKDGTNGLGGGGGGAGGGAGVSSVGGSGGSGTVILRIFNPAVPHADVAVAMATPETAWVDLGLVSAGSGATKADAYFAFGTGGNLTSMGKVATLSAGGDKRFSIEGLAPGETYAYELVLSNDAARVASASYLGTFIARIPEVPERDAVRSIAIVETNATSATLAFGAKEYEGTIPLYVCYGASIPSEDTNGWKVVKKIADVPAETTALEWKYPNGWGRTYRAARFFFLRDENYEELDYIESTGKEYVLTGIAASQDLKIAGKVRFTDYTGLTDDKWWAVFGAYVGEKDGCCLFSYNGSGYTHLIFNDSAQVHDTITFAGGEVYEFEAWFSAGMANLSVDGRKNSKATTYACSNGGNLPLFAMYNGGVNKTCNSRVPLYSFKMWKGETLVRDFIPVKKGGEGMLYDRVSGEFFQNASGAGGFTCGNVIGETTVASSSASKPFYFQPGMKSSGGLMLIFGSAGE